MKTRVLFLHSSLGTGGAETLRLAQLRYLDRDRVEPFVAVQTLRSNGVEPWLAREIRALDVPVFDLGADSDYPLDPHSLMSLRRLLSRLNPDILQTSMFIANTLGRLASLTSRRPRVISEEHSIQHWKRSPHILLDRILALRTSRILACSNAVAKFTQLQEAIPARKFSTLHNCFDAERMVQRRDRADIRAELCRSPDPLVILSVGRISNKKGFDRLITAVESMRFTARPVEVWIVGGDSEGGRRRLEALLGSRRLFVRFRLLGERTDIGDLCRGADIFASAARWEGFGIAIVEAMSTGLPVVAFNVDGVPEIVVNGTSGLLAPADDVEAFRDALDALANDPARAHSLGAAGKHRALRAFSPEVHVQRLHAIYDDVLSGVRSSRALGESP